MKERKKQNKAVNTLEGSTNGLRNRNAIQAYRWITSLTQGSASE